MLPFGLPADFPAPFSPAKNGQLFGQPGGEQIAELNFAECLPKAGHAWADSATGVSYIPPEESPVFPDVIRSYAFTAVAGAFQCVC